MADSGTPLIPIFPAPPRPPPQGWTPDYGNQLNRWLENITNQLSGFTYGRFNGMMLATTFPTSADGLRVGEVFTNGNVLTVVRANDAWVFGVSATTGLGSVTVTP
jgi:hypothetical protein